MAKTHSGRSCCVAVLLLEEMVFRPFNFSGKATVYFAMREDNK